MQRTMAAIAAALALSACGDSPADPGAAEEWRTIHEWSGTGAPGIEQGGGGDVGMFISPPFDVMPEWRVILRTTGCETCPANLHIGRVHPSGVVAWYHQLGGRIGAGADTLTYEDGDGVARIISVTSQGMPWAVGVQVRD